MRGIIAATSQEIQVITKPMAKDSGKSSNERKTKKIACKYTTKTVACRENTKSYKKKWMQEVALRRLHPKQKQLLNPKKLSAHTSNLATAVASVG